MKAIRINETGGPEVMHIEEIETPTPQDGQVLIKVAAVGINFADLAQRQGAYLTRTRTPTTLGFEFAGTVAALGPGVRSPAIGTRVVAFGDGGYAEYAIAPATSTIPIPQSLDFTMRLPYPCKVLPPTNYCASPHICNPVKASWFMPPLAASAH